MSKLKTQLLLQNLKQLTAPRPTLWSLQKKRLLSRCHYHG